MLTFITGMLDCPRQSPFLISILFFLALQCMEFTEEAYALERLRLSPLKVNNANSQSISDTRSATHVGDNAGEIRQDGSKESVGKEQS